MGWIRQTLIASLALWLGCLGTGWAEEETLAGPATRGWTRGRGLEWEIASARTNAALSYHALVIGVNRYGIRAPAGWDTLQTARADAEAIGDLLERKYGFEVSRLFDEDASRSAIIQSLDVILNYSVNDAVVIYFAGHGYFDPRLDEGFWIPADARKAAGKQQAREDWIWNSTLNKMLGASEARHILVIADSCYGGSLFRGEAMEEEMDAAWYQQAIARPSRYLISSGDLEPVLDSGAGSHTVFAQSLINFLEYPKKPIFSSSELGISMRSRVSALTGQLPRMGPLPVASHAGGEFIFLEAGTDKAALTMDSAQAVAGSTRGAPTPETKPVASGPNPSKPSQSTLADVVLMTSQGATNSAKRLLAGLEDTSGLNDRLMQVVKNYAGAGNKTAQRSELRELIKFVAVMRQANRSNEVVRSEFDVRPRIVACIGPRNIAGGTEAEAMTELLHIMIRDGLEQSGGSIVVERDALADVLQETGLGISELSDSEARLQTGRLLPACLMLFGDLVPRRTGYVVHLRLVDTESTQILGAFQANLRNDDDIGELSIKLAEQIAQQISLCRPLVAPVSTWSTNSIAAVIGSRHGAREGMRFWVTDQAADTDLKTAVRSTNDVFATITLLGKSNSELLLERPLSALPPAATGWNIIESPK